ncbi:hypothetical protein RISK_000858 [Rhodopirellula islandica]|uniref:Uncharacterized protein n=1 Tax=Rhodopirellula islandica TaxID=595434 RepID=A0A0J1BKL7_RHOIS|nr:hypothetical protein RISK_000858 [Rhodopirellula islandica]
MSIGEGFRPLESELREDKAFAACVALGTIRFISIDKI